VTVKKDKIPNNIRKIREAKLLSINEISRKVGLSPLTVMRVEETGLGRMETKRKILEALEVKLADLKSVFPEG
jgi:transcriptional regulator with XRE-family HTH domain